jgi:hypothetical protein
MALRRGQKWIHFIIIAVSATRCTILARIAGFSSTWALTHNNQKNKNKTNSSVKKRNSFPGIFGSWGFLFMGKH